MKKHHTTQRLSHQGANRSVRPPDLPVVGRSSGDAASPCTAVQARLALQKRKAACHPFTPKKLLKGKRASTKNITQLDPLLFFGI